MATAEVLHNKLNQCKIDLSSTKKSHHNNLESQIDCSAITVSNSNNEDSHNNDNSIILDNNLTTTKSNEASTISAHSRADDHAFSDKECTINCSSSHYNNSNDTHCDDSCIDGYITTDEACKVLTNNPPPPFFQKQLN